MCGMYMLKTCAQSKHVVSLRTLPQPNQRTGVCVCSSCLYQPHYINVGKWEKTTLYIITFESDAHCVLLLW